MRIGNHERYYVLASSDGVGSQFEAAVKRVLRKHGQYPQLGEQPSKAQKDRLRHFMFRMGGWRSVFEKRPKWVREIADTEHLDRILSRDFGGELPAVRYGGDIGDILRPYFQPAHLVNEDQFERTLDEQAVADFNAAIWNGSQDNWMGRMGHREWGRPFTWWQGASLDLYVERLERSASLGIQPWACCFDQPDIGHERGDGVIDTSRGGFGWGDQRAMFRDFCQAVEHVATGVMYSWELDERWRASDEGWMAHVALPELSRIAHEVNPRLRFGIHTAREEWGGFNVYGRLRSNATRMWQMQGSSDAITIAEVAERLGPVHEATRTQCVFFEHSPSTRLTPRFSAAEAGERAAAGLRVLQRYLPNSSLGSLNGDPRPFGVSLDLDPEDAHANG